MTESKLKRLKIAPLVSVHSYTWLKEFKESQSSMPYQIAPENSFYKNKRHRNYLSKWLEAVIVYIITHDGWFAKKVETTGRKVRTKMGKEIWVKSGADKVKGEPDIQSLIDGRLVYWEVKVGKDKLSEDQKSFIDDIESKGAKVHVVKTLDDFLDQYKFYSDNIKW